jgi:hypothetical protein
MEDSPNAVELLAEFTMKKLGPLGPRSRASSNPALGSTAALTVHFLGDGSTGLRAASPPPTN